MSKGVSIVSVSKKKRLPRRKVGTNELLVWGIPAALKREFKARCAEKGTDMKEAITAFMVSFTTSKT